MEKAYWFLVGDTVWKATSGRYKALLEALAANQPIKYEDYGIPEHNIDANMAFMSPLHARKLLDEIKATG